MLSFLDPLITIYSNRFEETQNMVQMDVVYEGKLRCKAKHGPSGNEIATDAPKDNQGRGEAFSPTDLVGAALGTCMLTIMGIYAQRHNLDLVGSSVRVEKEMVTEPIRRIGKLTVKFSVRGVPEPQRATLERAALTCPVHQSLHPDVKIVTEFKYE
jgi:putative redox protein